MILLFILSDHTTESRFIMPANFEELRRYLNLPPVLEFSTILSNAKERLFSDQSLEALRTAFLRLHLADSVYPRAEKAHFFVPVLLQDCSLVLPLPEDIRAVNSLCHHFVGVRQGSYA